MPATITGVVFNDLNHNGVFNPGEPGIPGVFIDLFSASGGTCVTAQTDATGTYSFSITVAGTYVIYETVANPGAACPPTTFTQPAGFTMSNGPRKISITVTATQITNNAILANNNFSHDTNTNPLSCNTSMIQFSGRPSIWYNINIVTGAAAVQGTVSPPVDINAIGYNPLDHYIYGYDQLNNRIVRVDNSGNVITLSPLPTGLPSDGYNVGTFDLNGFLYLFVNNESRFYVVDLRPNSSTFMKLVNPGNGFQEQTSNFGVALSRALNISDWVLSPQDNNLYGITPTGLVQRITPTTGNIANIATSPLHTGPFGAAAIDSTGTVYAISNNDGNIYRFTIVGTNATALQFSSTVTSSFNDATMCTLATVNLDFGDAPDTAAGNGPNNYSTLLSSNGPRHALVNALFLGTQVTDEIDALQNADATGDDIPEGIQDDGVALPLPALPISASQYLLQVTVTNQTGQPANLYGWVDFNANGVFEGNEASPVQVVPSFAGTQTFTLPFTVPSGVTLVPGETFVRLRLTTDTLVNQNASTDVVDTRSLGSASDGEVEDYALQIVSPAIIGLIKTATPSEAAPGDIVNYTISVKNPNSFALTNVRIEDSLLGLIDILSSLPGGAVVDLNAQFIVPPGTPSGSVISNTVTAISDQTPPMAADSQVTVLPIFSMTVTKTPDRITVPPGEIVTYSITVTNTSNAPISNVSVKDPLVDFAQVIPSLNAGESRTFRVPFTVPLGTAAGTVFTNVTTATSNETEPVADTATIDVPPIPDVFIFKSVSPLIAAPGETVTYTITISNAGNQTLTNVRIVDPMLNIDHTYDKVAPGDSAIISIPFVIPLTAKQGDIFFNVATVTTDETGPSKADAVVTVIGQPSLSLIKLVTPERAAVGSTVLYSFVVTNTGNTILTDVTIHDPMLGRDEKLGTLGVGETRTVQFPFVVPNSAVNPITNTATANGTFNSEIIETTDDAALTVLFPAFTVTKTVDQAQASPGDTVHFTCTIVNTGSIDLTNIVISDPLLSFLDTIVSLQPGASITETIPFVIPAAAAGGSTFTNVVTVTPTETAPQQDTAIVTVNHAPAISLTKSPDRANALPADVITYTITVTNTGNVALTNVTVRDDLLGFNTVIPTLGVGQSQSFTPMYVVPLGTPVGTVIVNRSIAFADQTDTINADANVLIDALLPALTVLKTSDRTIAAPGDTITYTITITNIGAVALTNVLLTDVTLGIAQPIGTLTPGQSQVLSFFFTIPADAPNGSLIVNTAIATSDQTNPEEGTSTVTVDPSPGIQVNKSINPAEAAPGQTVEVTIVVQNTGNVNLTNVIIDDPTLNFVSAIPSLNAGATSIITLPFITPDVAAGTILTNTAAATTNETGRTPSDATITVLPSLELTLVKRVEPSVAAPGESVTFSFELRNRSNIPLTNLRFIDDSLGIDKSVDTIPAGFFILLSRRFTIPEGTPAGTVFNNTAVLSSAETPPISASAQVTVSSVPGLTISKTVFPPVAFPGEAVFFRMEGTNTGNVPLANIRFADPLLGIAGIVVNTQVVGASLALIIPFVVPETAQPGETIVNTVFVDSAQTGPLNASAAVRIAALPLKITKSADSETVFIGDIAKFTITVVNDSNITANDVVLTDILQEGTQFVPKSVKVNGRTLSDATPAAGIPLGDISPGQSVVIVFRALQVVAPIDDKLRNQASASFQPANSVQRFTVRSNVLVLTIEDHEE